MNLMTIPVNAIGISYVTQKKNSNEMVFNNCFAPTLTHGRICWIEICGFNMRQNLVTFPAAAIRTSASLSRRRRTYAGTKSALIPKTEKYN